jgi:hypothetical protein
MRPLASARADGAGTGEERRGLDKRSANISTRSESAQSELSCDVCGHMVMRIGHDVLRGVTPEMVVAWWVGHLGRTSFAAPSASVTRAKRAL